MLKLKTFKLINFNLLQTFDLFSDSHLKNLFKKRMFDNKCFREFLKSLRK